MSLDHVFSPSKIIFLISQMFMGNKCICSTSNSAIKLLWSRHGEATLNQNFVMSRTFVLLMISLYLNLKTAVANSHHGTQQPCEPTRQIFHDHEYRYYKVAVANGTRMVAGTVPKACEAAGKPGLNAVCMGSDIRNIYEYIRMMDIFKWYKDVDICTKGGSSGTKCVVTPLSTDCNVCLWVA